MSKCSNIHQNEEAKHNLLICNKKTIVYGLNCD